MSVAMATMGKYWPQAGHGVPESPGIGGGGGGEAERPKPVVRISGVNYDKYKKEKINISVISVKEE